MCGIIAAVAERDVAPILLEGLRRLEYRGYDSAGLAVIADHGGLVRRRALGRVEALADALAAEPAAGRTGLAHTRWATHGEPSERNAHPHLSGSRLAVVHNGIIENHAELRDAQLARGYHLETDTDTEVVGHEIHAEMLRTGDLLEAVRAAAQRFRGAYALAVIDSREPDRVVAARLGSPLVIGVGIGEHFLASDVTALLPVTQRFRFLEDGDFAEITRGSVRVIDRKGRSVERPVRTSEFSADAVERGNYRHYMLKEIHEQPRALAETLEGRLAEGRVLDASFGLGASELFDRIQRVQLVACGTSYHAALVARNWLEAIARIPCGVEIASEYRYREPVIGEGTLLVTLSQSGETADTLGALRWARDRGVAASLAICNVPESSLVRESDLVCMTRAGPEIGVASTKAFTTQLAVLMMLTLCLGRRRGLSADAERALVDELKALPARVEQALELDGEIAALAEAFVGKQHTLFLGRGTAHPIAMEGALKLKEISYIHAEAYAAGELKHGPLALVDESMPVVAVAADDELLEKLVSNLEEVRARGGQLYVFTQGELGMADSARAVVPLPAGQSALAPVTAVVPLQLLAYHVAVQKGTDVDKPRNLAKSVTVE